MGRVWGLLSLLITGSAGADCVFDRHDKFGFDLLIARGSDHISEFLSGSFPHRWNLRMGAIWSIAIAGILAALISLSLFTRRSVRASLTIDASPEDIWKVLTDTESHAEWNPLHVTVDGEFVPGATMLVEMRNPDRSLSVLTPKIVQVIPNQLINQVGGVRGALAYDHTWQLDPVEGGTKVTQREEYQGIGVLFLDDVWIAAAHRRALIQLRDLLEGKQ